MQGNMQAESQSCSSSSFQETTGVNLGIAVPRPRLHRQLSVQMQPRAGAEYLSLDLCLLID